MLWLLQGTTTFNILNPPERCGADNYKWGHLAMTYTSIAILIILGDDLSRLDRKAIIEGTIRLATTKRVFFIIFIIQL